ncbi:H/ACA RNA-protein complex component Gar1 [Thermococcus cleftensis]|uniref:H/ACA RNA-protein complex component Gar1 n=1 Tax=Thermococcus cleftensis (strain DSM 27260 / KACC 17922 / CL1) TaxID=163003 RepID=I3ZVE8_THECF|nr:MULTISPECIES: Gar1/Naf1 family protein [Thermococcus]AFL95682.1 H/ACA RNA-protein complex component Gar1 [Thermococcus cleftensis]NJE04461.1 H/ACA RNA-protein complex protein Gar1 [Thermococcus sp. MV11]
MKRLGKVSHYAKQGFLILRTDWVPSLNDPVVDKKLTVVGVVKDVFGPVKRPYVAVKPRVRNPENYVGALLYVDSSRKKSGHARKGRPGRKGSKGRGKRPAPRKRG